MTRVRIFISSPGDVADERDLAGKVVQSLGADYAGLADLVPVLWENLAIPSSASFQEGIDVIVRKDPIDIAVFILWARLGTPLGAAIVREDGSPYLSGTEREFDLMLAAHQASGGKRPFILAYTRRDDAGFHAILDGSKDDDVLSRLIEQRKLAKQFIREHFQDAEGRNLRAYFSYGQPAVFAQRLRTHIRQILDDILMIDSDSPRWSGSPYRSLECFEQEHAPIFRGRDTEISEILQKLRECDAEGCSFLVIVGASGAGKSSLARAGVAAELCRYSLDPEVKEWLVVSFVPDRGDEENFELLAGEIVRLAGAPGDTAKLKGRMATNPGAAAQWCEAALRRYSERRGGAVRLLLLIDQMEVLWSPGGMSAEPRERLLEFAEAMARADGVSVLATLRSDYYQQAQGSEAFLRMKGSGGHYDLQPPKAHALQLLISQPARLAGLRFERDERTGRTLDQQILDDATTNPGALPLLQYALSELYDRRDKETGELTFNAYQSMGGVAGAVGTRAAETFGQLAPEIRDALGEILPLLVKLDREGRVAVRRRARLADMQSTPPRWELSRCLTEARFLTHDTEDRSPVVMLAHDALLTTWSHLRDWLDRNRELIELRDGVATAMQAWQSQQALDPAQADDFLLSPGLPLARAEKVHEAKFLSTAEEEFFQCSLHKERKATRARRRLGQALLATAVAGLAVMSVLTWHTSRKAHEIRRLLAESDAEKAERLFGEDSPRSAIWHLSRAVDSGTAPRERLERLWFAIHQRSWPQPLCPPIHRPGPVLALEFDPEGIRFAIASQSGEVAVFDSLSGAPLGSTLSHPMAVRGVRFNAAGSHLVTACDDALARLWRLKDGSWVAAGTSRHENSVLAVNWNPRGTAYATGSADRMLRVWSIQHPEQPDFQTEMGDRVHTTFFRPGSANQVLGVAGNTCELWDTETRTLVFRHIAATGLKGAQFSPDGRKLVTYTGDHEVTISDLDSGLATWTQHLCPEPCLHAEISPDNDRLVVAFANRVQVLKLRQPLLLEWEREFPDRIGRVRFTPEGRRLLVACDDGRIEVLDLRNGKRLHVPIECAGAAIGFDFRSQGNRLLAAGAESVVQTWTLPPPAPAPALVFQLEQPVLGLSGDNPLFCAPQKGTGYLLDGLSGGQLGLRRLTGLPDLTAAHLAPGGDRIIAGTATGKVLIIPFDDTPVPRVVESFPTAVSRLAFSSDGSLFAAGTDGGEIGVWEWPGLIRKSGAPQPGDQIGGLAFLVPGPVMVTASWKPELMTATLPPGDSGSWPVVVAGLASEPQALATSADHTFAILATGNGEVWKVTPDGDWKAKPAFAISSTPSALAISSDKHFVAVGNLDGSVVVQDLARSRRQCSFTCGDGRVNALAFSADGRWLACGDESGGAGIWNPATGVPVSEVYPHEKPVRHLHLSANSRFLVTACNDGIVKVWRLAPAGLETWAGATARRYLAGNASTTAAGLPFDLQVDLAPTGDFPDFGPRGETLECLRREAALWEAYRPAGDPPNGP